MNMHSSHVKKDAMTPHHVSSAMSPKTPMDVHISHHVGVEVGSICLQNSRAKFNNSLSVKLSLDGGESKALAQKGFEIKDGKATYEVSDTCVFQSKIRRSRLSVEVVQNNKLLASGYISIDINEYLNRPALNTQGQLTKWNAVPLVAVMDTGTLYCNIRSLQCSAANACACVCACPVHLSCA
jgi:hypothetical protein